MAFTQGPAQAPAPPQAAPLSEFVALLTESSLEDLRQRWRSAHPGVVIPKGLSRDLMIRGIVWNDQCSRYGGLPADTERVLDKMARQLATSGTLDVERSVRPKTGTRIIREWRGKTYVVEVADDGFLHDGARYASLSHVARAITGTRWSGPRFFGLKPRDQASGEGEG
ncbi:DUF2924 domain-containing protein [Tsuneonella rigui]|uniref:DUF2924 domain-containing protein n=1 Tax=Tsuneonella rigui TaxID=1708790 RepID=UPI000F7E4789|nr:DUF2924 domain-containing protein [Tsuneonella rigui]